MRDRACQIIYNLIKITFSQILDATFDDVLPLAIRTMSPSLEGLVRNIIRDYFNLNIAEQLNRYVLYNAVVL